MTADAAITLDALTGGPAADAGIRHAFFTRQGEGNIRPAHGEAADHIANGLALAAVAS